LSALDHLFGQAGFTHPLLTADYCDQATPLGFDLPEQVF
jgi:hypothetical protein